MERLRDVLEQSGRATDKVTSIVKHTDARLLELQELMGPVQNASLSNAHKNLTAVERARPDHRGDERRRRGTRVRG